jgi:hypothetical protein
MKSKLKFNLITSVVILMFLLLPINVFAADRNPYSTVINDTSYINISPNSMFITALDTADDNKTAETSSGKSDEFQINYHKILGWSTLGMMAVTIGSGFFIPESGHCALAGVTTGLAVATCVDGIYEYGGLISFKDGDWRYNTHAILGVLATSGFITTLALADGDGHVVSGIASGAAFSIALAVIYF